ncbi:hypothetical protein BCR34DRAFT_603978 [Clohesyomyces aquaticus]|uniref:Uncharacterized protein n=1 Tax=Clohesyomyces aquaticus TaxID=1231657 RepID=A0A1Y1ZA59_9PLEO|nr:hypothetical protein BCR34DRAFT_603978 [Clohesyomyces aquaticus]
MSPPSTQTADATSAAWLDQANEIEVPRIHDYSELQEDRDEHDSVLNGANESIDQTAPAEDQDLKPAKRAAWFWASNGNIQGATKPQQQKTIQEPPQEETTRKDRRTSWGKDYIPHPAQRKAWFWAETGNSPGTFPSPPLTSTKRDEDPFGGCSSVTKELEHNPFASPISSPPPRLEVPPSPNPRKGPPRRTAWFWDHKTDCSKRQEKHLASQKATQEALVKANELLENPFASPSTSNPSSSSNPTIVEPDDEESGDFQSAPTPFKTPVYTYSALTECTSILNTPPSLSPSHQDSLDPVTLKVPGLVTPLASRWDFATRQVRRAGSRVFREIDERRQDIVRNLSEVFEEKVMELAYPEQREARRIWKEEVMKGQEERYRAREARGEVVSNGEWEEGKGKRTKFHGVVRPVVLNGGKTNSQGDEARGFGRLEKDVWGRR